MKRNNIKGSLILIAAALIWGLAFVAQSGLADKVSPFLCNASRSLIAAVVLFVFWRITNKGTFFPGEKAGKRYFLKAGLICGVLLAVSVNFQQFGIAAYPQGVAVEARAGFITALYVILVPVLSLFLRKRVSPAVWLSVVVALCGIYLLCLSGGWQGIYLGDVLILLCALSFSLHIMAVDRFVSEVGGVRLSVMQFSVCAAVSLVLTLIFETPDFTLSGFMSAMPQILYLGIMSSGVAYTLQIVGQKYAEPAVASLSMSLESVFAALGGWLISGNSLSSREILGCLLVFAAIVLAQTPQFRKKAA